MQSTAGHADQVAGNYLNGEYRLAGNMNMEKPTAGYHITDLIFVVRVLDVEPGKHSFKTNSFRPDIDHIRRFIAATCLQVIDLDCMSGKNFVGRCVNTH